MVDLNKLVNSLKKNYSSVSIAGDEEDPSDYISTGNLALDLALEGGIALGYATEFSGGSASGKTTIQQIMLADFHKKYEDGIGIWVDRERAHFNERAEQLGINLNRMIVIKPQDIPTIPDATALLSEVLKSNNVKKAPKFIAIDSISAFADEAKVDKADMGKKAQSTHRLFRTIIPHIDSQTMLTFSNQRTFKVGVMFGPNETTTSGEGPKFYCTYRIKLENRKEIKDEKKGGEIIGNWIKAVIIKTRRGPSFREIYFPHYYATGIPYYGGYLRFLASRNYLQPKNKSNFSSFKAHTLLYNDETVNEFKAEEFLDKHPELLFDSYPDYNENNEDNEEIEETEEE